MMIIPKELKSQGNPKTHWLVRVFVGFRVWVLEKGFWFRVWGLKHRGLGLGLGFGVLLFRKKGLRLIRFWGCLLGHGDWGVVGSGHP